MRVHVLVITALPDELEGIKAIEDGAAGGWEPRQDSAGFTYHVREFVHASGGILRVAVARPVDMGGASASNVATRLVKELGPVCLAMSGICAGRRGEVSLGDVVVASRLFDAEAGKLKATTNADGKRVEEMLHAITTYNLDARWQHKAEDWPRAWCERWQAQRPRTLAAQEDWLLDALRRHEQGQGERPDVRREEALAATERAVKIREELAEKRRDAFLPGLAKAWLCEARCTAVSAMKRSRCAISSSPWAICGPTSNAYLLRSPASWVGCCESTQAILVRRSRTRSWPGGFADMPSSSNDG